MYYNDDGCCPTSYLILSCCHHQSTMCQPLKIQSLPFDNWTNNQDRNGVVDCSVVDRVLVLDLGDLFVIDLLQFHFGRFIFVIFLIVMFLIWITFLIRFLHRHYFYFFVQFLYAFKQKIFCISQTWFVITWLLSFFFFLMFAVCLEILFISNLLTLLYLFFYFFNFFCAACKLWNFCT